MAQKYMHDRVPVANYCMWGSMVTTCPTKALLLASAFCLRHNAVGCSASSSFGASAVWALLWDVYILSRICKLELHRHNYTFESCHTSQCSCDTNYSTLSYMCGYRRPRTSNVCTVYALMLSKVWLQHLANWWWQLTCAYGLALYAYDQAALRTVLRNTYM